MERSDIDRWIGIDCGFSQMTVAIVDGDHGDQRIAALTRTREPYGDGHDSGVALARLQRLLSGLASYNNVPVRLAGYCYEHARVIEAFSDAGWNVRGYTALNDVVGLYGLTDMKGNVLVGGCGSYSQVVYVDPGNSVCWPGDDLVAEMPPWLLSGWSYAEFLRGLSKTISEALDNGSCGSQQAAYTWGRLGPLLDRMLGYPELDVFLADAADAIVGTRDIFNRFLKNQSTPKIVLGGGAIQSELLWRSISQKLQERDIDAVRVRGEPAVGLARFAACNPDSDAWAYIGSVKPAWL